LTPLAAVPLLLLAIHANAFDFPVPGVYEIDGGASELRVLVYPAGLFKGLGHSHVITTSDIEGHITVTEICGESGAELSFPVESFEVDNETRRAEEGEEFASDVSDEDRRGTRRNMLGRKLLDSSTYSTVSVRSTGWSGELPNILVTATFTVKDQSNDLEFPVSVAFTGDRIVVTGKFPVTHRQLGLKPFKAALGTLRVRDEMEMKFRLTAVRRTE
jgi:hypothetical protein